MASDKAVSDGRFFDPVFMAKNTAVGFILTIALLFAASWAAALAAMPEEAVRLVTGIITYICVGVCGFRSARHSGANGLASGAIAGFVYVLLLFAVGCCAYAEIHFGVAELLTAIICILCGAVGGIIGVNTKSRRRR